MHVRFTPLVPPDLNIVLLASLSDGLERRKSYTTFSHYNIEVRGYRGQLIT